MISSSHCHRYFLRPDGLSALTTAAAVRLRNRVMFVVVAAVVWSRVLCGPGAAVSRDGTDPREMTLIGFEKSIIQTMIFTDWFSIFISC